MKLKKPKFWDYKKPSFFSYLLLPLSITIGLIAKINSKPKYPNSKIKTICVGNIYIGGTGKTSLTIKIKEILDKNNIKACFIKKFYPNQTDEQKLLSKNGAVLPHLMKPLQKILKLLFLMMDFKITRSNMIWKLFVLTI
jgi:tetraacyldisaccharide 4'-kinase